MKCKVISSRQRQLLPKEMGKNWSWLKNGFSFNIFFSLTFFILWSELWQAKTVTCYQYSLKISWFFSKWFGSYKGFAFYSPIRRRCKLDWFSKCMPYRLWCWWTNRLCRLDVSIGKVFLIRSSASGNVNKCVNKVGESRLF